MTLMAQGNIDPNAPFLKDKNIPKFTLDKEGFLEKVYALAGSKEVPIENHQDFSKRFYLLGEDTEAIRLFFMASTFIKSVI